MRDIKFKYWNGDKILNQESIINHLNKYIAKNDKHLMRYTGLKDKNGIEIYEGDIIKLYGLPNAYFQVVFKNQYVGGWVLMLKKDEVSLGARDINELKVVGNIYENPELLDK